MKGTQGFFCLPNRHSGLQAGSLWGGGQLCTHTSCLLVLPWKSEEKPSCCPEPADRWVQQEEATFWLAEGWLFIIMLDPLHPAPGSQSPPERVSISCTVQSFLVSSLPASVPCLLAEDCNSSQGPWEQPRVFKACHATVGATALSGLVVLTSSFP